MKLEIPFHRQKKSFTCGPASLQMVFSYFKEFRSQNALAKKVHATKENGTDHGHIIEAARKEKFYCYVNNNSTTNEIKHFIDLGLPVIVNYIEPAGNEGHYAIVSGYGRGKIIMNDPWNGKNFRLAEKEFLSRWYDYMKKHKYEKWIMVISKEDFHLGKQYVPY